MPQLTRDGTITFGSPAEFVREYQTNLRKDGLLVQSDVDWPLRAQQTFLIRVSEVEIAVPITAEVVYASGGNVGLQILSDRSTRQNLEQLLALLQGGAEAQPVPGSPGPALRPVTRSTTKQFPPMVGAPADRRRPRPVTGPQQPAGAARGRRMTGPARPVEGLGRQPRQPTGPVAPAADRRQRRATRPAAPPSGKAGRPARKGTGQFPQAGAEAGYLRRAGIAPAHHPLGEESARRRSRVSTNSTRAPRDEAARRRRATTGPALHGATAEVITLQGTLQVHSGGRDFYSALPQPLTEQGLARITLPRLVASVARAEVPLSLTIPVGQQQHQFLFNIRGNLVRYLGPDSDRELVERLVQGGKLSKELMREILQQTSAELTAEELMLHKRLIRPRDYWLTVREQVVDALLAIHKAGKTSFRIQSEDVRRRTGIPFGTLAIPWLEAALRWVSSEEVDALLADKMYKYPVLVEDPPWPMRALDLDKRSYRFLESSLVGRVQLEQVRRTSPLGANRSKRLLLSLVALGMIEFFDNPLLEGREVTPEMLLERELKKREQADKFEQLGVHWSVHPNTYQDALDKLKDEYGPNSKWGRFHPGTRATCEQIIEIARKALLFLRDEQRRKPYRKELVAHFQLESSAYLLFKQAEMMVLRKEMSAAYEALQMCLEMDPKPAYRALLDKIGGRAE